MPNVNINSGDLEVEEIIEIEPERTLLPNSRGLLDWVSFALTDLADAVDRLNNDLDKDVSNRRIGRDIGDILSFRRWSFVFPGGGSLRGNRRPSVIRPATSPVAATVPNAPVTTVPPTPVTPITPSSMAAKDLQPNVVIRTSPPPPKKS